MITSIKEWAGMVIGIAGASISALLGANMGIMKVLIAFMVIDYACGLVVAGVFKRSGKSETGAIESRASVKGLFRKGGMLVVVYIAIEIDMVLGYNYIALTAIYFFIANELISVVENLGLMGVPMPNVIKQAIEVLKKKGDSEKISD